MVTRRCSERRFFLRPCAASRQATMYAVGAAAAAHGVELHWLIVMSNHLHLGCTDRRGTLPEFYRDVHRNIAKCMNAHWGRWEPLFAGEQTSVVELVDPEDAFSKQIYSLTNPNKDHLVERAIDWPGASSLEAQLHDKVITVRRPSWFFDRDGKMPKQVTLRFTRPPGFEQLSQAQWIAKLKEGIAAAEAAAACERAASGKRVLGVKAIKRQSAFDSPKVARAAPRAQPARRRQEQVAPHRGAPPQQAVARRVPRRHAPLQRGRPRCAVSLRHLQDAARSPRPHRRDRVPRQAQRRLNAPLRSGSMATATSRGTAAPGGREWRRTRPRPASSRAEKRARTRDNATLTPVASPCSQAARGSTWDRVAAGRSGPGRWGRLARREVPG
jgi:hypothetical protein